MVVNLLTKVSSSNLLRQLLVMISCDLFCIGTGSTFGFSAVLIPKLKQEEDFPYKESYDAWIASSACIAMASGCIIGGVLSDKYGRRRAHLILGIPFVVGWIVLSLASDLTLLIVGRILTGICGGAFRSLGAVYLGEITNPKTRPFFIFSLSIFGNFGVLFSHIIGGYLNRRLACYVISVPLALGFVLQLFVQESPLWLIYKGRFDEGSKGFIWFRGDDELSNKELLDILDKHTDCSKELTFRENIKAMLSATFIKPLITAFLLFTTVQFCGVNSISFYAQDLIKDTFPGERDFFMLMLATDLARFTGVVLLFFFSSYIPRRKSYIIICTFVVLLLVAIVAYIAIKPSGLAWLAITVFMIYIALGGILIGLSWAFIGEIFPSNLRGLGAGIGASSSFFLLFLAVMITPITLKNYGIIATYSTFAICSVLGLIFLHILLPKSDGKTLQEIENGYAKK